MSDELKELLETGQIALMQARALQQAGHEAVIREAEEAWDALREKVQESVPQVLWPYIDLQEPSDLPQALPTLRTTIYLRVPGCAPIKVIRSRTHPYPIECFAVMVPRAIQEFEGEFYVHQQEGTHYDDVATALAEAEEYGAKYAELKEAAELETKLYEDGYSAHNKGEEKPPVPQWKQHLEHAKAYADEGSTGLTWAVIALVERFEQFVNFEA